MDTLALFTHLQKEQILIVEEPHKDERLLFLIWTAPRKPLLQLLTRDLHGFRNWAQLLAADLFGHRARVQVAPAQPGRNRVLLPVAAEEAEAPFV